MSDGFSFKPFGPEGPTVSITPRNEMPKEDSELTYWSLRILRHIPPEKGHKVGIRTLADTLNTLGDYSGYVGMVNDLVEHGYLKKDKKTSELSLTNKGRKELPTEKE
jgi:hypothetical protein